MSAPSPKGNPTMNTLSLDRAPAAGAPLGIVAALARVLLALMFVLGGIGKFANLDGTAGYIASAGLPLASLLAPASLAVHETFPRIEAIGVCRGQARCCVAPVC